MKKIIVYLLFTSIFYSDNSLCSDNGYEFIGKHFIASYMDCDPQALGDVEGLSHAMDIAVATSGATVLNKMVYEFKPNGLTMLYLLSESHASLHTYPECNACFIDLFTCGTRCTSDGFDEKLRSYLHPKTVDVRHFLRHKKTEEIAIENSLTTLNTKKTISQ